MYATHCTKVWEHRDDGETSLFSRSSAGSEIPQNSRLVHTPISSPSSGCSELEGVGLFKGENRCYGRMEKGHAQRAIKFCKTKSRGQYKVALSKGDAALA